MRDHPGNTAALEFRRRGLTKLARQGRIPRAPAWGLDLAAVRAAAGRTSIACTRNGKQPPRAHADPPRRARVDTAASAMDVPRGSLAAATTGQGAGRRKRAALEVRRLRSGSWIR